MSESRYTVKVEQVNWGLVLPWTRLFRAFRMAIEPGKLVLALALVVLMQLGGCLWDAVDGSVVFPGEIQASSTMTSEAFDAWRERQESSVRHEMENMLRRAGAEAELDHDASLKAAWSQTRAAVTTKLAEDLDSDDEAVRDRAGERRVLLFAWLEELRPHGAFEGVLTYKFDRIGDLLAATIEAPVNGVDDLASIPQELFVQFPAYLFQHHLVFLVIFWVYAFALWTILGGAIARMCALHAAVGDPGLPMEAIRFVLQRVAWFVITPLMPLCLAAVLMVIIAVYGLLLFYIPALNVVAAVVYVAMLAVGLLVVLTVVLWTTGGQMIPASLGFEGTDGFDAVARTFGYTIERPWHWGFYAAMSLGYGLIVFAFVAAVGGVTLTATRAAAGMAADAATVEALLPVDRVAFGQAAPAWELLGPTQRASAAVAWLGSVVFVSMVLAIALTLYHASNALIYQLLRRDRDGSDYEEVFMPAPTPGAPAPDAGSSVNPSDAASAVGETSPDSDASPNQAKTEANGGADVNAEKEKPASSGRHPDGSSAASISAADLDTEQSESQNPTDAASDAEDAEDAAKSVDPPSRQTPPAST